MAQVVNPIVTRNSRIFNSVFSQQSVSALASNQLPKNQQRVNLDAIRRQLQHGFIPLLGIDSADYMYGENGSLDGEPFRLPLAQCATMDLVRPNSQEETELHYANLSQSDIWQTLSSLRDSVGLRQATRLVAQVFNSLLKKYVRSTYSGVYRMDLIDHLRFWVENIFGPVISIAEGALRGYSGHNQSEQTVSQWIDSAVTTLGALRVQEMFTIIALRVESDGVIEDLKCFITSPATRTYLIRTFNDVLADNALHPGASTIDILRLYISVIKFFRKLDPKGVLLDRVARHIRRYLRGREDTVKVVVNGLLSDPSSTMKDSEVLIELATELHQSSHFGSQLEDTELDWDNMDWVPDPADAAPDYTKYRNADVLGSLISLFESKEVFVKELQIVFAERLLESKVNFELEIRILRHLKARLGDSSLQSCEVMLRDVLDSIKIDAAINAEQDMGVHAKVLSRLFWPAISEQSFDLPREIQQRQEIYERGFEKYKSSRKLSWIQALGHVEVELELEDRTVHEIVLPYQASVIYAFQSEDCSVIEMTIAEVATRLSMSQALARSACIFWVSKRILAETASDSFTVLERLSDTGDVKMTDDGAKPDAAAAAAEAAAAQAAREAEEEERKLKMAMYHQFVVSMLTNQGAMPLARIAMMLNIVVPGGFPFSNEELKDFLTTLVKDGHLQVGPGGNYKAV